MRPAAHFLPMNAGSNSPGRRYRHEGQSRAVSRRACLSPTLYLGSSLPSPPWSEFFAVDVVLHDLPAVASTCCLPNDELRNHAMKCSPIGGTGEGALRSGLIERVFVIQRINILVANCLGHDVLRGWQLI
jgi:hypothetical protein